MTGMPAAVNSLSGHRRSYADAGVLTKLDIMDRGTNAVKVLQNQVVPLRLGYIGEQGCLSVCAVCSLGCTYFLFVLLMQASAAEGSPLDACIACCPATLSWAPPHPGCACSAGVINRSQQDIITRRNIRDARAAEAAFFEAHPEYQEVSLAHLWQHCCFHQGLQPKLRALVWKAPSSLHQEVGQALAAHLMGCTAVFPAWQLAGTTHHAVLCRWRRSVA